MRTRLPLLLALAAAAACPAAAQGPPPAAPPAPDWQALTDPRDLMSFSWDRASLVREGGVVRVVVRAKLRIVSPGPGYADFLTEIRCDDSRSRIVRTTNYGLKGEPRVDNRPKAKFRKIDGGYEETLRAAVCPA